MSGGGAALIPNIASRLLTFLYKYKYIVQLCGCGVRGELGRAGPGDTGVGGTEWPHHTSNLTRPMLAAQGASSIL